MIKEKLNQIFINDFILFRLGIFFIPSAIALAGFFIIIALISQTIKKRDEFLKDKMNITLICISLLMIISCIIQIYSIIIIQILKLKII